VALAVTREDLKQVTHQPKKVITGVVSQFLLLPAATYLLIRLVLPDWPTVALGMTLIAACPGGNISNFYSLRAGGNVGLSIGLTLISTVLAPLMTPGNFAFWGLRIPGASGLFKSIELNVFDLFQTVFVILIIPLLLGLATSRMWPERSKKLSKPLSTASLVILVGFVVMAVTKNINAFVDHFWLLLGISILHNLVAVVVGFASGALALRNLRDAKTIAIETGVQNTGLGLGIALLYFKDLTGLVVIAAFWGIWNIAGGLLWSEIFKRWKPKSEMHTP
jgi:BASS family bile acid:Na+ symporter